MPKLNSRGDVLAGVGDGIVSINGVAVAERAGGACWLDDDTVLYQQITSDPWTHQEESAYLAAYHVPTRVVTRVAGPPGASRLVAGGGRWAAFLADGHTGVYGSVGSHPAATVQAAGPDGTIALGDEYQAGTGLTLYAPDGRVTHVETRDAYSVTVLGPDRAVWVEGNAFRALNVPVPQQVGGAWNPVYILLAGEPWVVYWTQPDPRWPSTLMGLVAHPASDPARGYILETNEYACYNVDAVALSRAIRVAWSRTQGERPDDIVVMDIDPAAPRVPLVGLPPVVVPPPVEPPPPVETPHVEPMPRPLHLAAYFDVSQQYGDTPGPWTCSIPGDPADTARAVLPVIISKAHIGSECTPIVALYCQTPEEIPDLRAALPGTDVLMVWDQAGIPPLGADIIGLELYSDATLRESPDSIATRVRATAAGLPAGQRLALVPQAFDHKGSAQPYVIDPVGILKQAIQIARDEARVVAILPFCAGRADTQIPVILPWLQALAAAIPGAPAITVPPPPPAIEPPPSAPPPEPTPVPAPAPVTPTAPPSESKAPLIAAAAIAAAVPLILAIVQARHDASGQVPTEAEILAALPRDADGSIAIDEAWLSAHSEEEA